MSKDANQSHQIPTNTGMMTITDAEFRSIRDLVYKHFGIHLTDQKRSLVVGRLQKLVRQKGYSTFQEYFNLLFHGGNDQLLGELVDRISTNHTFFFRENEHFTFFSETVLPEMAAKHASDKDLRIWCAAASSGEEPYTILMTMMEFFGTGYASWNAGLLGTDISDQALTIARNGRYSEEKMEGVPPNLRKKYFTHQPDGTWMVQPKMQKEATFRRFNLMNTHLPFKRQFDVIFCRNVMIYFDQQTRLALVERLYQATAPGGYLFIGHSESIGRGTTSWEYIKPAVYRKL